MLRTGSLHGYWNWGAPLRDGHYTYSDIGLILREKGDYDGALEWLRKAQAIEESTVGIDHPDTATTCNNIGELLFCTRTGDNDGAMVWYGKALSIRESVLGKDHPDTATTYDNIALVLNEMGDYYGADAQHINALSKVNIVYIYSFP
jgi:tetratricopeptide (TPR) repeat protein